MANKLYVLFHVSLNRADAPPVGRYGYTGMYLAGKAWRAKSTNMAAVRYAASMLVPQANLSYFSVLQYSSITSERYVAEDLAKNNLEIGTCDLEDLHDRLSRRLPDN